MFYLHCIFDFMETLGGRESQLKWEESIQKIKEYLKSLFLKKHKRKTKKISDTTNKELTKIIDQDEEDFDEEDNMEENEWWENDSEDMKENGWESGQQGENWSEGEKKQEFEIPPEDQDEYIPRDSEFGEAMWEQSRFAEIYPPFLWYYVKWKKSYFDRNTNLWSKKKQLMPFSHRLTEWIKKYTYTWVITAWINAIPLPDWARPDTDSLCVQWSSIPEFQVDQNGCIYLISKKKQFVSFNFWLKQHTNNTAPINADSEKIIFDSLSSDTQELLTNLRNSWGSALQLASAIKYYIVKNKKYSTKVQWTLRNKSNRNNYVKNLDESPILECFSANSLCVALCRELWIPARLVVGHMIQSVNDEWKACITKNDWHARSEIWDDSTSQRIRIDATPTQKEDWENSNENWQEQNENKNNNQNADNNFGDNQQSWDQQNQQSWNQWQDSQQSNKWQQSDEWENNWDKDSQSNSSDSSSDKSDSSSESDQNSESESNNQDWDSQSDSQSDSQQSSSSDSSQNQSSQNSKWDLIRPDTNQPQKSPEELLDEMIEKAKEDSLLQQSKEMKDVLDKLENAKSKEEIKDILDKSELSDFAKDMVDKLWEDKILDEEKKELESLDDERKIDEALQNSLLDDENKQKLKNYANMMKKKIEDEKKRMKNEMERLWFTEQELWYYKEYKKLEAEVEPEVKKQIRELQKILPAQYQTIKDDTQMYRSWMSINWSKLVSFALTWDSKIFRRNKEVRESNEINMFETIIIDTSGSMWSFEREWSILRESIKAAIIRAKVLEHFKVDFSIVLFGDRIDEVMSFGEKFSSRGKCLIPSKLIRAAKISWWNNREPISYVYQNMLKQFRTHHWKSFGNISFIWDWDLCNWQRRNDLKAMIEDLRKRWFWVTAYYVNDRWSSLIDYHFWTPEDWGAVYAWDSKELSKEIIEAHKTHLKKKIRKYIK